MLGKPLVIYVCVSLARNAGAILSYSGPDTNDLMTVPWQEVEANRSLEVVPSSVLRYSPDTLVPYEGQAG